jgi:hypothetical protein
LEKVEYDPYTFSGNIIIMTFQISLKFLPNTGEALSALLDVSLASSLNINNFILEGDSLIFTFALFNPNFSQDRCISPIILETLESIPIFFFWRARKLIEVQPAVSTQWHIGPQSKKKFGSIPIALSPPPSVQIVSGNDPPSLVLVF